METSDLLKVLAEKLDRLGLPYFVCGSMATIAYGEPRFTNDIDIVVDLPSAKAKELCDAFPSGEYYVSLQAVKDAIRLNHQFNILHPESGLKIDVIIPSRTEFTRSEMDRRRMISAYGRTIAFAAPEDVILNKLLYYNLGGSEKHLRDIGGVLRVQKDKIDRGYIAEWAERLGVLEHWQTIENPSNSGIVS